jgi:hypothetical protein
MRASNVPAMANGEIQRYEGSHESWGRQRGADNAPVLTLPIGLEGMTSSSLSIPEARRELGALAGTCGAPEGLDPID